MTGTAHFYLIPTALHERPWTSSTSPAPTPMEQACCPSSLPDEGEPHLQKEPEPVDPPLQVNGAEPKEEAGIGGLVHGGHLGKAEAQEEADPWETMACPVYTMTRTSAALSFATVLWDMPGDRPDACHPDPMDEEEEEEVMAGLEDSPTLRPSKGVCAERRGPPDIAWERDGLDKSVENGADISGSYDVAGEEQEMQEVKHPVLRSSECVSEAIKSPDLANEEKEVVLGRPAAATPPANALPFPEEVFCSGPEEPEPSFVYMTSLAPCSQVAPQEPPMSSAEGEGDGDQSDEERDHPQTACSVCTSRGGVEARGETMLADRAGQARQTHPQVMSSEAFFSSAKQCLQRQVMDAKEELQEWPEIALTDDDTETKPWHELSEGFYLQGSDLGVGTSASLQRVLENSQYLLDQSAEHLTSDGSRLLKARPSKLPQHRRGDQLEHMGQLAELDPLGEPQQEEASPEVTTDDEMERSEQHQEGAVLVELGLGVGGGGTETKEDGVTEMEMTRVLSNPSCLESDSEGDQAAEPVPKPQRPEHCVAESQGSPLRMAVGTEFVSVERPMDQSQQTHQEAECSLSSGAPPTNTDPLELHLNGGGVDRQKARRLAQRLYHLEEVQRVDVVGHMDKDDDFSRAVGEEFLCFFDFSSQTLDNALRSFLKEVVLVGESQERERVLQHFSTRFHQCNPEVSSSPGSVLTLTCAMMLLNTDLHGQNVGKAMSTSSFVSNMEGMNDGQNFNKDLLKSFYNSIKGEPLQWALDEEELKMLSVQQGEDLNEGGLRSKSNPFQDVPHDKTARVFKQGFLQRKAHADIDGKRTPWGKRSWKTFYGVLKGLVLYFQKDDYRKGMQGEEEVVSVHHALAEEAADYTKKPHVFRLQTADWRVFLFQASSKAEMSSWICRINLVAALHSSPPFPAAVGSQKRFTRPILPASQSAQTLERQLHSHAGMLESFDKDLSFLQESASDGRKARARDLEEQRLREEYLLHEKCRYEGYMAVLEAWRSLDLLDGATVGDTELRLLDRAMFRNFLEDIEEESEGLGMKKSVSSPSLEFEMVPPLVKVRRNVSERRTCRRNIIARRNKEL
ncbi:PH and SEC7 domain-containing protein 2 isoform X3 [Gadus chalcogrammus]|uniref:PH and SEC7 domain-containing protein 2 isoform X3 n=2 Tax=Gadus chalcogrammus TaxID=1042646 RepID=UPI0024C258EC|nr:PH and SEC7 domain-containing protein 2 isoform X3 [Gadus chalcogrammus]